MQWVWLASHLLLYPHWKRPLSIKDTVVSAFLSNTGVCQARKATVAEGPVRQSFARPENPTEPFPSIFPNFSRLTQKERPSNDKRQVETFTVIAGTDVIQFTNCISWCPQYRLWHLGHIFGSGRDLGYYLGDSKISQHNNWLASHSVLSMLVFLTVIS